MNTTIKPMTLFPTLKDRQEVIELANSKLPITNTNEVLVLLMIFQNTLLKEIKDAN